MRDASSPAEKISLLEEMMSIIPKHKGTDKLRAEIRKKISHLKSSPSSKKGGARKESLFNIDKEGAAQIMVIGPANSGKSSLVSALTHANPQISATPHTTWKPTPGMMDIEDIRVQLIDTPPLSKAYVDKEFYSLLRRCDLALLVVDIQSDPFSHLKECANLLEENRIAPVRLVSRYSDVPKMRFLPFHVLANKADNHLFDENVEIFQALLEDAWPYLPVSAVSRRNFDQLGSTILERLEIIRVYSKSPGMPVDKAAPFTLKRGDTVEQFALKIHKDIATKMKYARIWGKNVFAGQKVQRNHPLEDKDILEVHT